MSVITLKTSQDVIKITEDNATVTDLTVRDGRPDALLNDHHVDAIQLIPVRKDGTQNTQMAGAVQKGVTVTGCDVRSEGKLQLVFCSDGLQENITIEDNVLETKSEHFISVPAISGTIKNNRDSQGSFVPITLRRARVGGNSDGLMNVYLATIKGMEYQRDIVKDETLDHVTDLRFTDSPRRGDVDLYDFDMAAYTRRMGSRQHTPDEMRAIALQYGVRKGQVVSKPAKDLPLEELKLHAATVLSIEPALIGALVRQESKRKAFWKGHPTMLFERHVFSRRLKAAGWDLYEVSQGNGEIVGGAYTNYGSFDDQYRRFLLACEIDEVIAHESISMGRPQIMGLHWKKLGYDSPVTMYDVMSTEAGQFDVLIKFMKVYPDILAALKRKDWGEFKRLYNGYGKNDYAAELAAEYRLELAEHAPRVGVAPKYTRGTPPEVVRPNDPAQVKGDAVVSSQVTDLLVKSTGAVGGFLGVEELLSKSKDILVSVQSKTAEIEDVKIAMVGAANQVKATVGELGADVAGLQQNVAALGWLPWAVAGIFLAVMIPNLISLYAYLKKNGYFIKRS